MRAALFCASRSCAVDLYTPASATANSAVRQINRHDTLESLFIGNGSNPHPTCGKPVLPRIPSLLDRNHSDLNPGIVDECGRLDGCARWFGIRENGFVSFVHLGEVFDVCKVHGYRDDVFQIEAASL